MKVVIFGSSGRLGQLIVDAAIDAGHNVTAFVRNGEDVDFDPFKVHIVEGDIYLPETVERAIKGQEVVISALGMSLRGTKMVCSDGMKQIINAMQLHKAKKLIAISAFGAAEHKDLNFYTKHLRLIIGKQMADKDKMEKLIKSTNLNWTIVRPGTYINFWPQYDYKTNVVPERFYPRITRQAVAEFVVARIDSLQYRHQTPAISF